MGTMTLTEGDRRLLERLGSGPVDVTNLADEAADSANAVTDRLECMADNGLVARDEEGKWALTENGRRALVAPGDGRSDERIDTPPDVEKRLADADLRPDREDAVRAAFGFLQYWTSATSAEIRDAVYTAWPAGYASPHEWWSGCVRDQLADLPGVEAPTRPDDEWRYASDSRVEERPENGRWELTERGDDDFASAKHAIEHVADGNGERAALSAAFSVLESDGRTTRERLVEDVFDDHNAGFGASDAWYEWIENALETIPGVERAGADEWRYSSRDTESDGGTEPTASTGSEERADAAGEGRCPVCGERHDGRTFVDADKTVLPGRDGLRTCIAIEGVEIEDAEIGDGVGIAVYYHRRTS